MENEIHTFKNEQSQTKMYKVHVNIQAAHTPLLQHSPPLATKWEHS